MNLRRKSIKRRLVRQNCYMNSIDVINYFGTVKAVADALGQTAQGIYLWGEKVPHNVAYKLFVITCGALELNDEDEEPYVD